MFFGPLRITDGKKKCRDEKISTSKEPICRKPSQSVAELMDNRCRNCGRPFTLELLEGGEEPPSA